MKWFNEPSLKFGKKTSDHCIYFIDVINRGKGKAEECER